MTDWPHAIRTQLYLFIKFRLLVVLFQRVEIDRQWKCNAFEAAAASTTSNLRSIRKTIRRIRSNVSRRSFLVSLLLLEEMGMCVSAVRRACISNDRRITVVDIPLFTHDTIYFYIIRTENGNYDFTFSFFKCWTRNIENDKNTEIVRNSSERFVFIHCFEAYLSHCRLPPASTAFA